MRSSAVALTLAALSLAGCAATSPRLRFVSSYATQASWSLVVDDRARAAEIWIDGRPRTDGCNRVRTQIRCELRGLWPGGHTVELRTAGALLRRSVLIGRPWPQKLALVRVRNEDEAEAAAKAGSDGIIVAGGDWKLIVDAAHKAGVRALVVGDAAAIEWAGADGVLDGAIPKALQDRFPEARAITTPPEARDADEAQRLLESGSAVVSATAFDLLRERKRRKGQVPPVVQTY
ncbi:MAG: hypothetical protein JWN44_878 [Myxococcales bacterium]|nr:hypothetical protein [Myxococcales bacterium]